MAGDAHGGGHAGGGSGIVGKVAGYAVAGLLIWIAIKIVLNVLFGTPVLPLFPQGGQQGFAPLGGYSQPVGPRAPSGAEWTNQGKNPQCTGKAPRTSFICVSPTSGRKVICYCD